MSSKLDLGVARQVCELASGGLLAGSSVVEVQARGVQAVLSVRLNVAEVERRDRDAVSTVLDGGMLDGLMQLPAGLPVPESSLSSRERMLLRRCPKDALERSGGEVVRRLACPLEVDLAVVRVTKPSRAGLLRAGKFGAYCQSAVWLDGPAAGSELLAIEAGIYGLGLVHAYADEAPALVVAPQSSQFGHTPAGWLFAEQVYAELRSSRAALPTS
ncbi:hypothetical protein [Streptomyces sp. NPDC059639]|uniref:hypothetical protein n=1 Tax=Streptomyces sp. NPDC059639 TaxID=3346891 RepID=UPI003678BD6B